MRNAEAIVEDLVTGYASGANALPEGWMEASRALDRSFVGMHLLRPRPPWDASPGLPEDESEKAVGG